MRQIALLLLTITVCHASVTVTRTSNDGRHPSTMEIEVQLPNSNTRAHIPLTRTDPLDDVPITVIDNGLSRTFSSRQIKHDGHSHYRDIESNSVISVREVNGKRRISGHVMHEGASYFLEPLGDSEHRVTENVVSPAELLAKQIRGRANVRTARRRVRRQTNTSPTKYTVELHLLLDSTVWAVFKKLYGNESTAMTELKFYYTHILNGMDTVYRNIKELSVSVSCTNITISKQFSGDNWMPSSLDVDEIAYHMTNFTSDAADHYMAFTRKNILKKGHGSAIVGAAYKSGVCLNWRKVSVVEDRGLQSWTVAAHELGHNMGSNDHDGHGDSAECPSASKHVMADHVQASNVTDVTNSYKFSHCSVRAISQYIKSLGPDNCLVRASGSRRGDLMHAQSEGQRIKQLNQVCRLTYPYAGGWWNFLSEEYIRDKRSVCATIECIERFVVRSRNPNPDQRAPVGYQCDIGRTCDWSGQCTPDKYAPATS